MKTQTIFIGAFALFLFLRGKKKEAKRNQVEDSVPRSGTDFTTDLWTQLNGGGLTAAGYPNIAPGAQADPGRIGQLQLGLMPSWNGTLPTA